MMLIRPASAGRLTVTTGFAVALLVSFVCPCFAQQTYVLKLRTTPGERWTFDVTSSIKQKGQVTVDGQPSQQIDQRADQRRKGVLEILASDNGKPTAMKVTFDRASTNEGSRGGQPAPPFTPAGKTVTIREVEGGGVSTDLPDQPDPQTLAELTRMLDPDTSVYPDHPVAVNDEWDADPAALARQFQLAADDKVSMKCKLLGIKDLDGRQVAEVSLNGQVVKHDQGFIETTTTLAGMSRVDLLTGQALNADITGKMTSRGNRTVNGPKGQVTIAVNADGTLETHQTVRPVSPDGGGGQPVAVAPALPNPAPPMKPDAGHDNPLAARAPAPFAGTFTGDELSVDLTAGEGDRFTGTMRLRDKTFPVTAHGEGTRLLGTFQAGGSSFDFAASLDGDAMKLTSGGSDYTLRRAGPAPATPEHPAGKPAPRNPLAQ